MKRLNLSILKARLRAFWFPEISPQSLALLRILFYAWVVAYYLNWDFRELDFFPIEFFRPWGFFKLFHLMPLPSSTLDILQVIWKGSLIMSCVGLLTPIAAALSFFIGFYLLGLNYNYGFLHWTDAITILVLGVMWLAPCADVFSFDSYLNLFCLPPSETKSQRQYGWPIRLVQFIWVTVFFAAGLSKIRNSGLEWITSDTLSLALRHSEYSFYMRPWAKLIFPIVEWVSYQKMLCHIIAAMVLLLELSTPLALFSRRARLIIIPCVFCMQIAITFFLYLRFLPHYIPVYAFWVPGPLLSCFSFLNQQLNRAPISS
jgi:hypothetical protein